MDPSNPEQQQQKTNNSKKCFVYRLLPEAEAKRATAFVVNNELYPLEDHVAKYNVHYEHLVPSLQAEAEWRNFVSQWADIDHCFNYWMQFAAEVNNFSQKAIKEQLKKSS